MGLDIYLDTLANGEANARHDAACNAFYERPDYAQLSEGERDRLLAEIPPYVSHEDVPSATYPDHLFNRRYLRSSYNDGGFNHAVSDFLGAHHDLYWIFEPLGREWDGDEGRLTEADVPKLRASRERAVQVADELRKCEPLRVMTETAMIGPADHMWSQLPSDDEVLAWYRDEKARHANDTGPFASDGGYMTAKGGVLGFAEGVEALALTLARNVLGQPCAAIVYRPKATVLDSYVQSAEITAEFIDEALSLIERDGGAYLSWSG